MIVGKLHPTEGSVQVAQPLRIKSEQLNFLSTNHMIHNYQMFCMVYEQMANHINFIKFYIWINGKNIVFNVFREIFVKYNYWYF